MLNRLSTAWIAFSPKCMWDIFPTVVTLYPPWNRLEIMKAANDVADITWVALQYCCSQIIWYLTPTPRDSMHTTGLDISTLPNSSTCRAYAHYQADILEFSIITRVYLGTPRTCCYGRIVQISGEVHKCNIQDFYKTGAGIRAVISTIFRDSRSRVGTLNMEVGEKNVANKTPTSAAQLVVGLVAGLWYQRCHPSLGIDRVVHIFL